MGKVNRITDEKVQKIIEMYLVNYTKVDIAKQLDISTQSVTKYLVKNNIKQKEHFLSEDTKDLICKLYVDDDLSIEEIHKQLNVDHASIKRALKAKDIELRNQSHSCRKYDLNENYFDDINTQNKAYILGLLYADGNVGKNKNNMQITLQEEDKHILEQIKLELETDRPLYFCERTTQNSNWKNVYMLNIDNQHMHQTLISHGVVPQKTFIIKFPEWLDQDLIRHFIRGYFDGDGCFGFYKNNKGYYKYIFNIVGTNDFCLEVKNIIQSIFDINCYIGYCHQKYDSPIRVLSVSGKENCKKILDWIYDDAEMLLYRKYNKYLEFCNMYNSLNKSSDFIK